MIPTENQEAETLSQWLKAYKYKFTHIANESWLPPKVAMLSALRKKRMWLSPWFPDYCIILKRWALLFIELKRQKRVLKNWKLWVSPSKISDEQKDWLEELSAIPNVEACIAYWSKEAINKILTLEN